MLIKTGNVTERYVSFPHNPQFIHMFHIMVKLYAIHPVEMCITLINMIISNIAC